MGDEEAYHSFEKGKLSGKFENYKAI